VVLGENEEEVMTNHTTYRIYVGHNVNGRAVTGTQKVIRDRVGVFFSAFTLLSGTGVWKGKQEPCTVVEIVGTVEDRPKVEHAADVIRYALKQDAVLVTAQITEVTWIQNRPEPLPYHEPNNSTAYGRLQQDLAQERAWQEQQRTGQDALGNPTR
jgi:hypothetical protein